MDRILKLYVISQDTRFGYDTYDSAVVTAYSAEDACEIHPDGDISPWVNSYSWAKCPEEVVAEFIGIADDGVMANSVILASFNAG